MVYETAERIVAAIEQRPPRLVSAPTFQVTLASAEALYAADPALRRVNVAEMQKSAAFVTSNGLITATEPFMDLLPMDVRRRFMTRGAAELDGATYHSCFISYSSGDVEFVKTLHRDLSKAGVRTWFAPVDLRIGDHLRTAINQSIKELDRLLLVLSKDSAGSQWVEHEVESALERERTDGTLIVCPIMLDRAILASELGWVKAIRTTRHIGDFTSWRGHDEYKTAIGRLLRDLRR